MTKVQDTTDRATKWMRYIARGLAVIAAGAMIYVFADDILSEVEWLGNGKRVLEAALYVLFLGGGALIPWRWERAGGILLVLQGFVVWILLHSMIFDSAEHRSWAICTSIVAWPFWVAGILFLRISQKSRRQRTPQNSA